MFGLNSNDLRGSGSAIRNLMTRRQGRRLLAVMFTDIEGYTALMRSDEDAALLARKRHGEVLEAAVSANGGDVLQYLGDGSLTVFDCVADAARAAIDVQQALSQKPAVPLRIGIHQGDISYDAQGAYGDCMNVASRIESLATAGSILISAKAHDEIKNRPDIRTSRVGDFEVKGVEGVLEVYAILPEGRAAQDSPQAANARRGAPGGMGRSTSWRPRAWASAAAVAFSMALGIWSFAPPSDRGAATGGAEFLALAVLPLVNLIGDPEQDYFVAGMHEALISELGKIDDLDVISRTSVTPFANTELSAPEIARELGVTTVLEGGVQRAGDRVRVNVQLIDGISDQQLWSESYDQELTPANIFAIQSDVARKIAGALRATLAPGVEERLRGRPTESLEAYDLYNRGRYLYNRFATHEDRLTAADLFQRAIVADSSYALAYVGLAEAFSFLGGQGLLPPEVALPDARVAVEKALDLDETLGAAHAALGSVLLAELQFEEAEKEFLRALELSPSSADVHRQYGRLLNRLSRSEEAVQAGRRAVELDPLSVGNRVSLTSRLFNAREYEAAIAEGSKVLELAPDDVGALFFLGISYVLIDRLDEGVAALSRAAELDPGNPFRVTALAFAQARFGHREEALALLEPLDERGPVLKEIAIVLGELGELDLAFQYLDRALEEDPRSLTYLRSDPTADSLKADHRMADLMRKVGL